MVSQESLSSHQSIKPFKNLSLDISWPSFDVSTYVSYSVVVGFQPSLAMSLSTEHLVLLGTPGRLQFWNMTAVDNGFLVASRLILLKSLAFNLHRFFLNTFLATLLTICNKTFDGSVIKPQYFSNFPRVLHPSERLFTIFDFSESVKSLFWPILPEEKKLPNNYAHFDIGC